MVPPRALTRRQFLKTSALSAATLRLAGVTPNQMTASPSLPIAFLHLAPRAADLSHNKQLIVAAVRKAAALGARWILTPELSVSGYTFADQIGTDWIMSQPDAWMSELCRLTARLRITLVLSHPERDPDTQKLYNSLFVLGPTGELLGRHRKINPLRVGAEAWATPGAPSLPIRIPPYDRVGMLICADAYSPEIAQQLHRDGAQLLVSSAAWAPGLYGPNGEWERCTRDTGLSLLVCNRTGPDRTLDFTEAESVIVKDGRRLLSLQSERSAIFMIEWNLQTQSLATTKYQTLDL
ncbi:MAG: carbon-nitrogen hydrolase family protein [Deltaproteobacteria bacterium]|nr:carbon-nitrogen hydrolase family protein [Deltaproteobacteria bacterium]